MIVSALISLKKHCTLIWRFIEFINAQLFNLLHPSMYETVYNMLQDHVEAQNRFSLLEKEDVGLLNEFFEKQPEKALTYFHPHKFDKSTLERLLRNKAFIMMKVTDKCEGKIVGYFFLRCFFIGRAFHGLIVDESARGKGIGTAMWMLSSRICQKERLRMFATISADNLSSLASCKRGTDAHIIEHLSGNYLLVECKKRNG